MNFIRILPIIIISGIIGYITNVIAVKCLFRPLKPMKILGTPFIFQGLIPKRHGEIAHSIGEMIHRELLNEEDLIAQIISEEDEERLKHYLTRRIQMEIVEKTYLLPRTVQGKILIAVEEKMDKESEHLFQEVKDLVEDQVKNRVDVANLVEEKILALDLEQLESLVLTIAGKELKHIEWLGLIMGLGIGIVQGILIVYIG
ncbi:MAG: DUF445 family protein [Tissierellia bacterium]|nr:DUF445 family protein [Tissierellia bacterium]